MRQTFGHEAILTMASDADIRAPGAAITVALCGHWDHQPPCPLAAHHTRAERVGDEVRVRILFATEPDTEPIVRQRIDLALSDGELQGPDAAVTRWRLLTSGHRDVTADEAEHAARLARD